MAERLVHLVDDEESFRRSTSFLLKTSGYKVCTWSTGNDFLREARTVRPGCVLLDVRMPGSDGLDVLRHLGEIGVCLPVIMVTGHGDVPLAVKALKLGASDFLLKPFERAAVLACLEQAFERLENFSAAAVQKEEALRMLARLTEREREVMAALARGLANKSIATELGISARTVEVHRARALDKLNARSLSEALKIAFTAGLDRAGSGESQD